MKPEDREALEQAVDDLVRERGTGGSPAGGVTLQWDASEDRQTRVMEADATYTNSVLTSKYRKMQYYVDVVPSGFRLRVRGWPGDFRIELPRLKDVFRLAAYICRLDTHDAPDSPR